MTIEKIKKLSYETVSAYDASATESVTDVAHRVKNGNPEVDMDILLSMAFAIDAYVELGRRAK